MTVLRIGILAWRYLRGHWRRYIFLLAAVSFGFAIITTMTALSDGMSARVNHVARVHYGGDVFVVGYDNNYSKALHIANPLPIEKALEEAGLGEYHLARRTILFNYGILYFNGTPARQKSIYGVDWADEAPMLSDLEFLEGGIPSDSDDDAILISSALTQSLGARLGDRMIMQASTLSGQVNTASFVIAGIFHDTSIFGYFKSYISRKSLNRLLGYSENASSSMGISLSGKIDPDSASRRLAAVLPSQLQTPTIPSTKAELEELVNKSQEGIFHVVFPLKVYVSEVNDLVNAMRLSSYVVFVMMVIIVLISIAVTYKLVIHERTREIGTLRAIGMQRRTVRAILLSEALYLFLASLLAGIILSGIFLGLISLISFNWIPGFEIFTQSGRLMGRLRLETVAANALLLLVIIFPAALIPASRAAGMELSKTLST